MDKGLFVLYFYDSRMVAPKIYLVGHFADFDRCLTSTDGSHVAYPYQRRPARSMILCAVQPRIIQHARYPSGFAATKFQRCLFCTVSALYLSCTASCADGSAVVPPSGSILIIPLSGRLSNFHPYRVILTGTLHTYITSLVVTHPRLPFLLYPWANLVFEMEHSDEKDSDANISIGDEKRSNRQSITSTTYTFDRTTLFSDDATIRAHTPPSPLRSPNVHKRRASTSARLVPNAFALSRACSPVDVVKSNDNSIMGVITSFTISRTARFLNFLGLKSTCISERNVLRHWMRELDELLGAPPQKLLESQEKLAQTLDDLLTIMS